MRPLLLLAALSLLIAIAGCGGGGGTLPNQNTRSGAVQGQLVTTQDPTQFNILVDGSQIPTSPAPDGTFTVPDLPPGPHSIAVVGGGGMIGAYTGVTVQPGQTVSIGPVTPVGGGQIAGLVNRKDDSGTLTPLAGVTVVADPAPVYTSPGVNAPVPSPVDGDLLPLKTITDDNGSYLMPAVPAGAYVVTVSVPGLMQGVQWVSVSPGATATADFQLQAVVEPGVATIKGLVQGLNDGKLAPLQGAMVSVSSREDWEPPMPPEPLLLPVPGSGVQTPSDATAVMPPDYWFNQFTTLTNAAGRYTLNVPSGSLTISVWKDGYVGVTEQITVQAGATVVKNYQLDPQGNPPPPPPLGQ